MESKKRVAAALGLALLLVPFCRDGESSPAGEVQPVRRAPEPQRMPESDELNRTVQIILGALEEDQEGDGEPRVQFEDPSSLYAIEQGLTDCIEAEGENTCYLVHTLSTRSRIQLECFSTGWEDYVYPLRISSGFSYGEGGAVIKMTAPNGEDRLNYEYAPHPAIDEEAAEDFYTDVCRDALSILEEEPKTRVCNEEGENCMTLGSEMPWGESLVPQFEDSFDALMENGFRVKDSGMKFLRVDFELGDGSISSMDFFPKPGFCAIEEGLGMVGDEPCWNFKAIDGGLYSTEQLVDFALEHQEELWEE